MTIRRQINACIRSPGLVRFDLLQTDARAMYRRRLSRPITLPASHRPHCFVTTSRAEGVISTAPATRDQLLRLLKAGVPALARALASTQFCGSPCWNVILRAKTRAEARGARLRIVVAESGMV